MLFAERANEFEYLVLSKPFWGAGVAKASVNSANHTECSRPEARRACHEQDEFCRKAEGGPNR